jgi:dihydrofolate reductase
MPTNAPTAQAPAGLAADAAAADSAASAAREDERGAASQADRLPAPRLVAVAAVARNGTIGDGNDLVWRIPEDMAHFRRATMGHPVLMGRRTWDGLPPRFRPLPGRRNLVLTRQPGWQAPGAEAVHALDEAIDLCSGHERLCVIGGAQLWALALPRLDELILTEIDHDFAGDTVFPPWDRGAFVEVSRERMRAAPPNGFELDFVTYRRRAAGAAA